LLHHYEGAVGFIDILGSAFPAPTVVIKFREVDDDHGIVNGVSINIFAGHALLNDKEMLLNEMKKQMSKEDALIVSTITADWNYLSAVRDKYGAFRIISVCMCLVSIGALLDTVWLLIEYIKFKEGNIVKIMNTYFFGGISISTLANICRILIFIDPLGTQNICTFDVSRPLYSFTGTLHIMESILVTFQWLDMVDALKASLKFEMRKVSYLKNYSVRVVLLLISLCLIVSDLYMSTNSLYGSLNGNVDVFASIMGAIYLLLLSVFEIWVRHRLFS
jgi:hypothetical protein